MSFKDNVIDLTTVGVQVSETRNKFSRIIFLVISIFFLVLSLIVFIFSWKLGLFFLGIAILLFLMSKLGKLFSKMNKRTLEKLQKMKEPDPDERIWMGAEGIEPSVSGDSGLWEYKASRNQSAGARCFTSKLRTLNYKRNILFLSLSNLFYFFNFFIRNSASFWFKCV